MKKGKKLFKEIFEITKKNVFMPHLLSSKFRRSN